MSNILMCGTNPIGQVSDMTASNINYNNTSSSLTASDVQDAIDELNNKIPTVPTNISAFTNDSGYITTDNTRVLKTGDTISGIFAPSSDRGCSIGQDNQRINYAWIYRVVGLTSIEKSANSGAYRQTLQDKAGTLALMENLDIASLYTNGYFPNGGTWNNRITLSDDIDNYKYLGFSWVGSDQDGYGGLIEKIIDVGNFKKMTQQKPFPLYHDILTPSDTRAILLAYYDDTHIDVWRGAEIYQYNRLWITGIIKK